MASWREGPAGVVWRVHTRVRVGPQLCLSVVSALFLFPQVRRLRDEVAAQQAVAAKAQQTWDTFRKERDFHRMHHQRVVQEKNRLVSEIKRLKKL